MAEGVNSRLRLTAPVVDYRRLRPGNISSEEFRHVWLLLFWPVFGLVFLYVERFYPVALYYPMYSPLDEYIPFCEYFLIPYLFWFIYLAGMHIYTFFYDIESFRKLMRFIIFTYSVTILIYFLFPTCQLLRPAAFERDNAFTRFMAAFYKFDTNTNVCPSLHVVGSLAVMFTGLHCPRLEGRGWKTGFIVSAVLICMSTVFLKQHSILDVLAALPICIVCYYLVFRKRPTFCSGYNFIPSHD